MKMYIIRHGQTPWNATGMCEAKHPQLIPNRDLCLLAYSDGREATTFMSK